MIVSESLFINYHLGYIKIIKKKYLIPSQHAYWNFTYFLHYNICWVFSIFIVPMHNGFYVENVLWYYEYWGENPLMQSGKKKISELLYNKLVITVNYIQVVIYKSYFHLLICILFLKKSRNYNGFIMKSLKISCDVLISWSKYGRYYLIYLYHLIFVCLLSRQQAHIN